MVIGTPRQVVSFWGWRVRVALERLLLWFVWKLPGGLVYWCSIRLMSHATTGEHGDQHPGELLALDALKRWEERKT